LFNELKVSVIALEIEPIAICRSLLVEENNKYKGQRNKNYGIIDIGARRTNMTIYSGNTILLSVSIPISGEKITEIISQQLELSRDQAEKAKIICGLDENKAQGIIKKILAEMIDVLILKIKNILTYYYSHFEENGPINKILLCGGGANIKGLDKIITENILVESVLGDPFANLNEKSEDFKKIFSEIHSIEEKTSSKNKIIIDGHLEQNEILSYSTAIGLAMREIFISE
jgi:type IV pilus assembly protein PilM